MAAVATTHTGKAVGKDAAFQLLAKRLEHIGLWRVIVALPIELACTCQLKPGLKVLGYRFTTRRIT